MKDGENADGVVIWYLNDAGKLEQISCSYNKATGMATFTTNHLSYYVVGYQAAWANPYSDVASSDWFYDAVKYISSKKLMGGTSEKTFEPDADMTRSMVVTVLYRMAGSPSVRRGKRLYRRSKRRVVQRRCYLGKRERYC